MPVTRGSDEFDNMRLVEQQIKKKYRMMVISEKQYQSIKEAYEKKSVAAALKVKIQSNEKLHQDWLQQKQIELQKELLHIDKTAKTSADKVRLRREAENKFTAEKIRYEQLLYKKQKSLNSSLMAQRKADEAEINKIARLYAENQYKKASIYDKKKIKEQEELQAHQHRVSLEQLREQNQLAIDQLTSQLSKVDSSSQEAKAIRKQLKDLTKEQADVEERILTAQDTESKAAAEKFSWTQKILNAQKEILNSPGNFEGASKLLESIESATAEAKSKLEEINLEIAVNEKLGVDDSVIQSLKDEAAKIELSISGFEDTAKSLYAAASADDFVKEHTSAMVKLEKTMAVSAKDMARKKADDVKQQNAEQRKDREAQHEYAASDEGKAAERERFSAELKENATDKLLVQTLTNLGNMVNAKLNEIDNNIDAFYEYQSSVEARLQGSEHSYQDALKTISKNVGMSGLVSQKEVIKKLVDLSDKGVAYNLELRAFLATISDDIAQTFDAFDSNLLTLISLQQSDTPAAGLGMEGSLIKLFN